MATRANSEEERVNNVEFSTKGKERKKEFSAFQFADTSVVGYRDKTQRNKREVYVETLQTPGALSNPAKQSPFSSVCIGSTDVKSPPANMLLRDAEKKNLQGKREGRIVVQDIPHGTADSKEKHHLGCDKLLYGEHGQANTNLSQTLDYQNLDARRSIEFKQDETQSTASIISKGRTSNVTKDVSFEEYNRDVYKVSTFSNGSDCSKSHRNVLTFVSPSPKKRRSSYSSVYSSDYFVSRTRKLAYRRRIKPNSISDPYLTRSSVSPTGELKLSEKSISSTNALLHRHPRVYEGGRFLFCKSRPQKKDQSPLRPRLSLSQEEMVPVVEAERTWKENYELRTSYVDNSRLPVGRVGWEDADDNVHSINIGTDGSVNSDTKVLHKATSPAMRTTGRCLARQKSFEEDENTRNDDGHYNTDHTLLLLSPVVNIIDTYQSKVTTDTVMSSSENVFDEGSGLQTRHYSYTSNTSVLGTGRSFTQNPMNESGGKAGMSNNEISTTKVTLEKESSAIREAIFNDSVNEHKFKVTRPSSAPRMGSKMYTNYHVKSLRMMSANNCTNKGECAVDNDSSYSCYGMTSDRNTATTSQPQSQPRPRSSEVPSNSLSATETISSTNDEMLRKTSKCTLDLSDPCVSQDDRIPLSNGKSLTKSSQSISSPLSMNDFSDSTNDVVLSSKIETSASGTTHLTPSPPKTNRIKLALTTSHAGIFVTEESQDDPSLDPEGPSIDQCPSWLCANTGGSTFLTPNYQPSDSVHETSNSVVVYEKKNNAPISFSSTSQLSDPLAGHSFDETSSHLSSRYKNSCSSQSSPNSGLKRNSATQLERHSSALLSPSFRTIKNPMSQDRTIKPSGELCSSGDSARSSINEGATSNKEKRAQSSSVKVSKSNRGNFKEKDESFPLTSRSTTSLRSPSFRVRSHDSYSVVCSAGSRNRSTSTLLSPTYVSSISSDGDSGLDTPRSFSFTSRNRQRTRSFQSPNRRISRNSSADVSFGANAQYSNQNRSPSNSSLSQSSKSATSFLKRPSKSDSKSGSFMSMLSPKKLFRRSSDQSGRSSNSKSSRKQLSDFPDDDRIITLNVSGRKFKLHEFFTSVYPETLLGNNRRNEFYDHDKKEYFFDHDPDIFRHIWNFYYTGKLHFPKDECVELFVDEMQFFGVSDQYFCTCCWEDEYDPAKDKLEKIRKEIKKREQEEMQRNRRIPPGATLRQKIWLTTKDPIVSRKAKVFYFFSILAIVLSTFSNIAETVTTCSDNLACKEQKEVYFYIDSVCVGFFTLEYALRVLSAPDRCKFIRKFMSIIDVLAIIPYYCDIVLRFLVGSKSNSGINFLEMLRILRIVRIFKLLRHSRRLQVLLQTVKGSTTELGFILFIYFVMVIVFSSIIYYAEMQDNPKFVSIPEAMWYAVITTTTTGYGDIVPETVFGKLIGCACCLLGVLVVALPIPILQIR